MRNETTRFFATTAKGMEELLLAELVAMGAGQPEKTRAGVAFSGPLELAYRACLWSRIANRVLLPLKTFEAPTPEKLYGGVKSIRWTDHLDPDGTLAVDFSSSRSEISHTQFGALKVKDAIVDQFRSIHGRRPSVNLVAPSIRVNVYLHENRATVSLDLSGESLHQRGYREQGVPAPLKENLAAAILQLAGWPELASRGAALIDPMCGSGTLPIEAALMASDTAPGLRRPYFGFLGWQGHVPALWARLKEEAENRSRKRLSERLPRIIGTDENFRAVRVALANVERSGMHGKIHIEKRELSASEPLETRATPRGIFILNPPYGERLGETEALKPLYKQIGDTMKQKFKGWEGYVFTSSPELSQCIGLKPSRRHVLFNGALECRLFKYELY